MTETGEKRHPCPLCNGEGLLPEGRVPVDIMPDHEKRITVTVVGVLDERTRRDLAKQLIEER